MKLINNTIKILLIDDEVATWNSLLNIFASHNYQVKRLSLQQLDADSLLDFIPDLILIDISIARLHYNLVNQKLKSKDKKLNVPVIILVLIEEINLAFEQLKLKFADYLIKPLRPQEVLIKVKNQIKINKLKQELFIKRQKLQKLGKEIAQKNQQIEFICNINSADNGDENHDTLKTPTVDVIKLCSYNAVLSRLTKHQSLSQGNLSAAFGEVTEAGAINIGVERASIWVSETTHDQIHCLDLFEKTTHKHSSGLTLSADKYPYYFQALQQNEVIAVADLVSQDPRTQELSSTYLIPCNITSILYIPIRLGETTVGVFCLESVGVVHHWTEEDQNFARALSNLVSLALEARERQRAEAAHRTSEKKLASAFRASPDPIALCTFPEGRYIEVNDSFCRFFGYSRTQVIGTTNTELNIWVNPQECHFLSQILKQTKTLRNHEVDFRTCSGEIKTVLLSVEMIEIDGQKIVLATAKDITERKQAENESRLLLLTTQAITRAIDVKSALTLVLRLICQTIGWDFGEAWIPSDDGSILEHSLVCHCEESRLEEFCDRNQNVTFTMGMGLPGRVWETKRPEWIEDVSLVNQSKFLRSFQAAKVGFKAGFAVPILAGREVVAVLVFFKSTAMSVDKRLLMLVGTVATQLGSLIQQQMIEAAHRKSEERLQLALSASELGLWDWNIQTGKIYCDWKWRDVLGYAESEIDQHQLVRKQLIHPEDWRALKSSIHDHLEGITSVYEMEFRMRSPSGEWKWIQSRGQIVERDEQGVPLRMTGTNKDITERKTLEKQLKLREARLNAFFSGAPVGMNILDHKMRLVQINDLMADIYGKPSKDLIGKTLQEIAPHIDPLLTPFCRQVLSTGEAILNRELSITAHDVPNGLRHFLVSYFPIPGEDNSPSGVGTVMLEISGLKRAETALRESIERERAIAQVIQRMRQTLDLETIFTATTAELRQVLNCDRVVVYRFHPDWSGEFVAESVGTGWTPLMELHQQSPNLTKDALKNGKCLQKMLDTQEIHLQNNYIPTTSGTSFCCVSDIYQAGLNPDYINLLENFQAKAYVIVPILCGNQLWGLLASYQNSTARQWKTGEINIVVQIGNQLGVALQQAQLLAQTQQQSQALQAAVTAADTANRAKSEFLANMSHELRTPLNAILGFTQLMSHDNSLSYDHQQNLAIINRAGEHLLNLINDILEMSKIEAGRTTLNLNSFDLIRMLNNVQEMLQIRATGKNLHLVFEYAPNLPKYIKTDESKLRQVLLNIVGNAIKFTSAGSVTLHVSLGTNDWELTAQQPEDKNTIPNVRLMFEIQDTGIGIASQELELLFEAFGQTESGRQSQQGTGLGLAISRKYVQMMGGEINVNSNLGRGSQFTFDIQVGVVLPSEMPVSSVSRWVIGLAPQQEQYRILVVDDISDSRLLLVKLLSSVGFTVQEAANGKEAVNLWETWHPHLIFMDMRMPVLDGYQATHLIRSLESEQQNECSIISMTTVGANTKKTDAKLNKSLTEVCINHQPISNSSHPQTIIIALTANAFEEQREAIVQAGCDDLINKPFQKAQILEKLSQYLGVRYLYQEDIHQQLNIQSSSEKLLNTDGVLDSLLKMPQTWVADIYQAAAQGSDDLILDLIHQMPTKNSLLQECLSCLASNFQFERIMALTHDVGNKKNREIGTDVSPVDAPPHCRRHSNLPAANRRGVRNNRE
ncbi:GAF domain-containing protein [Nostoc sp. CMAA1605]|uniref:GAF domain-containing protein n=1 Tax=Nostoc sp. CMAA1605 TaxID=2055159 RepID=UPI001F3EBC10|nr:GAF domain-containing protein [Nostoc sp. CMAA1605]MCF4967891.1 PAS domain S-box protein [Nostoc sp. CMAA1605]